MGAVDSGIEQGWRGWPDIGAYLLGGGAIGPDIRVRDMGLYAAYVEGVRLLPP